MRLPVILAVLAGTLTLAGCSGGADNNVVANDSNVSAPEENAANMAVTGPRAAYEALADCAAVMTVSANLLEERVAAATGSERESLDWDLTMNRGRSGGLSARAMRQADTFGMPSSEVSADVERRATAVAGERGTATLADFSTAINARADACYAATRDS